MDRNLLRKTTTVMLTNRAEDVCLTTGSKVSVSDIVPLAHKKTDMQHQGTRRLFTHKQEGFNNERHSVQRQVRNYLRNAETQDLPLSASGLKENTGNLHC